MINDLFPADLPFLDTPLKRRIRVVPVNEKSLSGALDTPSLKERCAESGFKAKPGTHLFEYDARGHLTAVLAGTGSPLRLYDLCAAVDALGKSLSPETLDKTCFTLEASGLSKDEVGAACVGWALACHKYEFYKKEPEARRPRLVWPKSADRARVTGMAEGILLLRNLVNTPSNDLGPAELEEAARIAAKRHKATIAVTGGEKLESGFPLIHAVGISSPRAPRLIDMRWGKAKDPKVTIVGKGVCFDTGGLNLKPGQFMLQMKKDMGGAAHALGMAMAVMAMKLPVRLRVLIPAVENSVSGTSFRPRDVYRTRRGLTVETSDTDAEGRLVLADALTYACEEKPDLLIDCATLTGSARSALGYDIPAIFSNQEQLATGLQRTALAVEDPLWMLPMWQGYKKEIASDIADVNNIGSSPAGAIHGALFLEHFVEATVPWVHIDMYAWEQNGKPGRPKGGADTGLRAVVSFLEQRYG